MASNDQRMLQEAESLRAERQSSSALLATLQALQNEVQRSEGEAKSRLNAQVDNLQVSINCR